jgi:hypothetical protein
LQRVKARVSIRVFIIDRGKNLVARPKSEDKKQALLEAATVAFAQSGIAASTSLIARNAGVAEGPCFATFPLKTIC